MCSLGRLVTFNATLLDTRTFFCFAKANYKANTISDTLRLHIFGSAHRVSLVHVSLYIKVLIVCERVLDVTARSTMAELPYP
jgi:isoprenylcysteine carboxyl methyltransferase (ICMT) family protein YpbQ